MAIEMLQPKPERLRAIEITCREVLVQGTPCKRGTRVRVAEADAYDLVHAKQAKFLDDAAVKAAEKAK